MANTYYSPDGNAEIWKKKPAGYYTVEAWELKCKAEEAAAKEAAERAKFTFTNMYTQKLQEINTKFDTAMSVLTRKYPEAEAATFTTQETAAKSFLSGSSEYVPYLTLLADSREITVPELVAKIMKNAAEYHTNTAELIGTRHKYLDLLSSFPDTTDPAIIRDIDVSYIRVGE